MEVSPAATCLRSDPPAQPRRAPRLPGLAAAAAQLATENLPTHGPRKGQRREKKKRPRAFMYLALENMRWFTWGQRAAG